MPAQAPARKQRDWAGLPLDVLQHIIRRASTWQAPGSCVASAVCGSWRSAAAACLSKIRVLYLVGHADQSFATWLEGNSHRVESLTLSGSDSTHEDATILPDLIKHAAAEQAAGRPLALHTLRVLQGCVSVATAGRLLAVLPRLLCLQLAMVGPEGRPVLQQLAPLKGATQLEQLYLKGPGSSNRSLEARLAGLLPPGLKRLSWDPQTHLQNQDLSHLTQVTFLALRGTTWASLGTNQLPPGLQQLEVLDVWCPYLVHNLHLVNEQRQVVSAWEVGSIAFVEVQQQLGHLPNLQAVSVPAFFLNSMEALQALEQVPRLSSLTLRCREGYQGLGALYSAIAMAGRVSSLRRVHLVLATLPNPDEVTKPPDCLPKGLPAYKTPSWPAPQAHVTQLRLSVQAQASCTLQEQQAWGVVMRCLPGLRWLSVPDVLLGAGSGWLAGMQQLRVLVVKCTGADGMHGQWLEGCTRAALPPRLQVLGVSGLTAQQAASMRLRRRLRQELAGSECEVVVGVSLDEAADPTQQLAGLPATLQQALA